MAFRTQRPAWLALQRAASERNMTIIEMLYSLVAHWLITTKDSDGEPYLSCDHPDRRRNEKVPNTTFCPCCGMTFWDLGTSERSKDIVPKIYLTKNRRFLVNKG